MCVYLVALKEEIQMNLYHLQGFNYEQALDEWTIVFKTLDEYDEERDMYKVTLEVIEDSCQYTEKVSRKTGQKFMPKSNVNEMFTAYVDEKPVVKKFETVTIEGVKNAYVAGNPNRGRAIFEADKLLPV